jgi:hypothetical protein
MRAGRCPGPICTDGPEHRLLLKRQVYVENLMNVHQVIEPPLQSLAHERIGEQARTRMWY